MTAEFVPTWVSTDLPDTAEFELVDVSLSVEVIATVLADGKPVPVRAVDGPRVVRAKVNGVPTPFVLVDDTIVLDAPRNALVELFIEEGLIFSGSNLPPGITVTSDGRVRGVLGPLDLEDAADHYLTVRATYTDTFADQSLLWRITPELQHMEWRMPLPPHRFEGTVEYLDLGVFKRSQRVYFPFRVENPENRDYKIEIRPVENLPAKLHRHNGSLPVGVFLTNNSIGGGVRPLAEAGEFFFQVFIDEIRAPEPLTFKIAVAHDLASSVESSPQIEWDSPAVLGTLREGVPCHLSLQAKASVPIQYYLAPHSPPLPNGIYLARNGEFQGLVPYFKTNDPIEIDVRAVIGEQVEDRSFTILVEKVFATSNFLDIQLKLQGDQRRAFEAQTDELPSELLFRKDDEDYQPDGSVLVLTGLTDKDMGSLSRLTYRDDLTFIASELKVAQAVERGRVIYEVVYRELIDPIAHAGGFTFDGGVAVSSPVAYPQDTTKIITPPSIKNIRADLVEDCGLEALSPLKRRSLGPNGGEALPLWMTSPQEDGEPLGYVLAMVEGYAAPNKGRPLREHLEQHSMFPVGQECLFDRFLISDFVPTITHFDVGTKAIPLTIPVDVEEVELGRWIFRTQEMTTLSGEPIQYKINRFTGKMEVAGSTQVRNVLVHLDLGARPQAGKPLIANNKASIPTGAYTIGVTGVVLDGVPSTSYTAGASAITGIDPAVTEVVLSFAETTFMDKNLKAVFDDEPVKRPKYQKLKDTIQIVRL